MKKPQQKPRWVLRYRKTEKKSWNVIWVRDLTTFTLLSRCFVFFFRWFSRYTARRPSSFSKIFAIMCPRHTARCCFAHRHRSTIMVLVHFGACVCAVLRADDMEIFKRCVEAEHDWVIRIIAGPKETFCCVRRFQLNSRCGTGKTGFHFFLLLVFRVLTSRGALSLVTSGIDGGGIRNGAKSEFKAIMRLQSERTIQRRSCELCGLADLRRLCKWH